MGQRETLRRRAGTDRVRVLYITGYGRSGSTLLMRLLGAGPDAFAAGEVMYIWNHGFRQGNLCGCGEPFRECEFWTRVSNGVFGSEHPDEQLVGEMERLQRASHGPSRVLPLRLKCLRSGRFEEARRAYGEVLERLYRQISIVAGCKLVVDSSKSPQYARFLMELPGIELYVVHLVRDSRATAWSWSRLKYRPDGGESGESLSRVSVARSALHWNFAQCASWWDRRHAAGYLRLRYEDFVESPELALNAIGCLISRGGSGLNPSLVDQLQLSHSVSGNPDRFRTGPMVIVGDDRWKSEMRRRDRILVSLLTAPILSATGYRLCGSNDK